MSLTMRTEVGFVETTIQPFGITKLPQEALE